jgi:tetratricopeptide (TPR) repeat protein
MASCTERVEYPAEFAVADSLADHNEAKKALGVLDSLTGTSLSWPEAVRMRYALLRYKAQDKAFMPITTDSIILPILHYYEQTREEWLPEAYYYAGRTYTDLGDAPRALDYYRLAATEMEGNLRWRGVLSRTYAQMADLFSKRWMTNESIKYYKKSAVLSEQERDSSSLVSTYSKIAADFQNENWDSAAYYNEKAGAIAILCHDSIWYYQQQKIQARACISLGKFDEARNCLTHCFSRTDWPGFAGSWIVAATLYDSLGRTDTLIYCLKKAIEQGNIYACRDAAKRLSALYNQSSKADSSHIYMSMCLNLTDSIELMNNSKMLQISESSYNYNVFVRENEELRYREQEERAEKHLYQMAALFIIFISGGVLFYIFKRYKWQKSRSRAQLANLKTVTSERISSLEEELLKREVQYSDVTLRNDNLQREIELTRSELESVRQQQRTHASQLELERSMIKETDLYKSLVPYAKIKDSQVKAIQEYYQKNNPKFLESLTTLCDLSAEELTVSLLIRMGYNQRQISDFMCRVPGTIQNMRQKIILRVKGPGSKAEEWNRIIESL